MVTEHSAPMHHAFGMSSLTTSRLLIVCKASRNSWKHCYFERSLFDYMDHDNCPLTFFKALLNIIGGKGAISNINYYNYYREHPGWGLIVTKLLARRKSMSQRPLHIQWNTKYIHPSECIGKLTKLPNIAISALPVTRNTVTGNS